jgi:hypothetical protein
MKILVNICDLYPNDSHKSFYGKAKVKIYSDNTKKYFNLITPTLQK